ncbi:MAG: hypothetical protein ACRDKG_12040 [Actinomycetota bacterium]
MAGALGANAILRQPARYFSRAILQIDQLRAIVEASNQGPVDKLNQLRTKYSLLARTRRITGAVAQKTGIPEAVVAGGVSVGLPGPSLLLVVDARVGDPAQARVIANAVAEELVGLVKAEMEAAEIPPEDQIVLTVVAPAQPGTKFEPTRSRAVTTGTLAGILSLIGVIAVAETVRSYRRRL